MQYILQNHLASSLGTEQWVLLNLALKSTSDLEEFYAF